MHLSNLITEESKFPKDGYNNRCPYPRFCIWALALYEPKYKSEPLMQKQIGGRRSAYGPVVHNPSSRDVPMAIPIHRAAKILSDMVSN
uniref:Uncharacterized protein n=1 Tax=Nelumbo nucifera TaxID=4432 RepID=A0A822XTL0_NELNU|nr:TPA_asm: hypothetical protein HUJ06_022241 [Nelumbo nucifera]